MKTIWAVKETACYPNSFKVYPTNRGPGWDRNTPERFHPTPQEAQRMADKWNKEGRDS